MWKNVVAVLTSCHGQLNLHPAPSFAGPGQLDLAPVRLDDPLTQIQAEAVAGVVVEALAEIFERAGGGGEDELAGHGGVDRQGVPRAGFVLSRGDVTRLRVGDGRGDGEGGQDRRAPGWNVRTRRCDRRRGGRARARTSGMTRLGSFSSDW